MVKLRISMQIDRPLNVLHLSPSNTLGGARLSLITLIRSLDRNRYNPIVALPGGGMFNDALDEHGIAWVDVTLRPFRKVKYIPVLPFEVRKLARVIEERKIDMIHCNEHFVVPHALAAANPRGSLFGLLMYLRGNAAQLERKIPIVSHMRLSVTPRHIVNYRLAHIDRVIAVSEKARRDFAMFPWSEDKVRVVYNAVYLEPFAAARSLHDQTRQELGISEQDILFGVIGVIEPRKRILTAIEAFAKCHEAYPNTKLMIIGEPRHGNDNYYKQVLAMIEDCGIKSAVKLLPWQKNIAPYIAALDVNLFMSGNEGFARIILESAACAVPTLGSNIAPNREAIEDNVTGWLVGDVVESGNEDSFKPFIPALVEKMKYILGTSELIKQCGHKAQAVVSEKFFAKKHAQDVMAVFDETLKDFTPIR